MSNQIFSNETEKYIQGRSIRGSFEAQNIPLTIQDMDLTLTSNDLPVTFATKTITFTEEMIVYISYTMRFANSQDGTFREAAIYHNGVFESDMCINPVGFNNTPCLNLSASVKVLQGQTISFRTAADFGGIAIVPSGSKWSITRIY